jgi:uncharacterized membrane protein YesL
MNGNSFVQSLDAIFRWITRLAFVNLLWIAFSLLGLIFVGIFPATVATLAITRKWLTGSREVRIFKVFKDTFKKEFIVANIIGWLLTILGILLYVNYQVMVLMDDSLPIVTIFAYFLILFFYGLFIIWVFPMIANYNGSIKQYLKNSFIIGIGKIHVTLALMIWLFVVLYVSLEFPATIIFCSISIAAVGWNWLTLRAFDNLKQEQ